MLAGLPEHPKTHLSAIPLRQSRELSACMDSTQTSPEVATENTGSSAVCLHPDDMSEQVQPGLHL